MFRRHASFTVTLIWINTISSLYFDLKLSEKRNSSFSFISSLELGTNRHATEKAHQEPMTVN